MKYIRSKSIMILLVSYTGIEIYFIKQQLCNRKLFYSYENIYSLSFSLRFSITVLASTFFLVSNLLRKGKTSLLTVGLFCHNFILWNDILFTHFYVEPKILLAYWAISMVDSIFETIFCKYSRNYIMRHEIKLMLVKIFIVYINAIIGKW